MNLLLNDHATEKTTSHAVDPERSALMAKIGSRDTKPELLVRKAAHAAGLRFRLQDRRLPGKPDLSFPSRKLAMFVHGCFWHRHPGCKATRTPKSRIPFWEAKFQSNVERDRRVETQLEALGWKVIVIWECEARKHAHLMDVIERIKAMPPQKARPQAKLVKDTAGQQPKRGRIS